MTNYWCSYTLKKKKKTLLASGWWTPTRISEYNCQFNPFSEIEILQKTKCCIWIFHIDVFVFLLCSETHLHHQQQYQKSSAEKHWNNQKMQHDVQLIAAFDRRETADIQRPLWTPLSSTTVFIATTLMNKSPQTLERQQCFMCEFTIFQGQRGRTWRFGHTIWNRVIV